MLMHETIQCPYCFESVSIQIAPTEEGTMIRDCDVCCNPLELRVERSGAGGPQPEDVRVRVRRAQ